MPVFKWIKTRCFLLVAALLPNISQSQVGSLTVIIFAIHYEPFFFLARVQSERGCAKRGSKFQ